MHKKLKLFIAVYLVSAVCASASAWDDSPFMTESERQAKSAERAQAAQQAAAQDPSAPTAVRQDNVLIDPRDNQIYKIAEINGDIWMVQNLNYREPDSFCFENNKKKCEQSGRLYMWKSAMKACPDGWRLPTINELRKLVHSQYEPTPPGGFRAFNGDYYQYEGSAVLWSRDEDSDYKDYAYFLTYSSFYGWEKKGFYRDQANSVRCIKGEDHRKTKQYQGNSRNSSFDKF